MLASNNSAPNRFENTTRSASINAIINKAPPASVNKIVNKKMCEMSNIASDDLHINCNFNVEKTGYYHLTYQSCTRNDDNATLDLAFYQLGVCRADLSDSSNVMKSCMVDAPVLESHIVCDSVTSIIELQKDVDYIAYKL